MSNYVCTLTYSHKKSGDMGKTYYIKIRGIMYTPGCMVLAQMTYICKILQLGSQYFIYNNIALASYVLRFFYNSLCICNSVCL